MRVNLVNFDLKSVYFPALCVLVAILQPGRRTIPTLSSDRNLAIADLIDQTSILDRIVFRSIDDAVVCERRISPDRVTNLIDRFF